MSGWNAKIRCVYSSSRWFRKSEIYTIKDGVLYDCVGDNYMDDVVTGLEELNSKVANSLKFELVSEELLQPHKSMLKDGDYVIQKRFKKLIVSLVYKRVFDREGYYHDMHDYNDELIDKDDSKYDIMEIWRDGKLIAKRTEKSKSQLEIEEIEKEIENAKSEFVAHTDKFNASMDRLTARLSELKEGVR